MLAFVLAGLVISSAPISPAYRQPYARSPHAGSLLDAVKALRPAIIGVAAVGGAFTEDGARDGAQNERPIVFALSNQTSKSEYAATQAYRWSDERAFLPAARGRPGDAGWPKLRAATGQQFVHLSQRWAWRHRFGASRVTDEVFAAAAHSPTRLPADLRRGISIRHSTFVMSRLIAAATAAIAYRRAGAGHSPPTCSDS